MENSKKILEFIPEYLKQRNNWVFWKLEKIDGKFTKRPYNVRTGKFAMSNNPDTWCSYKEAMSKFDRSIYDGLGFVFDTQSNLVFIDLDHCIEDGKVNVFASNIINKFTNTYAEISQSGTGIHIICNGTLEKALKKPEIEMYSTGRFVALTGKAMFAKEITDYQYNVDKLYEKFADKVKNKSDYTKNVCDMSSHEIIDLIRNSKNGNKFWDYYAGSVEPNSENTLALASMLAFWCGNDFNKIKEIMNLSRMRRDKFERPTSGKTWIDLVIEKAIQGTTEVYNPEFKNYYQEKNIKKNIVQEIDQDYNDYSDYFITSNNIQRLDENNVKYVKSGFNNFDGKISGFALGEVSVWSGLNSSGKSAFLIQQIVEYALQGEKTIMFSGEMLDSMIQNILFRILAGKQNLKQSKDGVYWYLDDEKKKQYISNWLNDKFYLYKNSQGMQAEKILSAIKFLVKKEKVKMVILDNLMIMNIRSFDENKYEAQAEFVKALSELSKELMIHIHIVMHPRKSSGFLRKDDISGTADLTNAVDNVFIVHRNNRDFQLRSQEVIDPQKRFMDADKKTGIYKFDNIIEVCKNRRNGVQDEFLGFHFEIETKKFLSSKDEERLYLKYMNYQRQ